MKTLNTQEYRRKDHELPLAVSEWGWKFHHLGIPVETPMPGERYIPHLGIYVTGFESSPYGIEFMRFEPQSKIHELVKRLPHLAFVVEDLVKAIEGKVLLAEINSPSPGVKVAMIEHQGAPVELMEFAIK